MVTIPKRPDLYVFQSYETEMGMGGGMPIDSLVRQNKQFLAMGAGQECPLCHTKQAVFFGNQDTDHWCILCQVRADGDVESENA